MVICPRILTFADLGRVVKFFIAFTPFSNYQNKSDNKKKSIIFLGCGIMSVSIPGGN